MAKQPTNRRPLTLKVGFEPGRGSRDALGRAYERLLPSLVRAVAPGPPPAPRGAHHEVLPAESHPSGPAARGHLGDAWEFLQRCTLSRLAAGIWHEDEFAVER
jgi:hypothetical protein